MVHVREDGAVWGEVLTRTHVQLLPNDFSLADKARYFDIPTDLRQRQLQSQPHHEEIIVSLVEPSGYHLCSFLMSQLPDDSRLRAALVELVQKVQTLAEQSAKGSSGSPRPSA
jgi:hypothetical protein